jgi:hypothetical protein
MNKRILFSIVLIALPLQADTVFERLQKADLSVPASTSEFEVIKIDTKSEAEHKSPLPAFKEQEEIKNSYVSIFCGSVTGAAAVFLATNAKWINSNQSLAALAGTAALGGFFAIREHSRLEEVKPRYQEALANAEREKAEAAAKLYPQLLEVNKKNGPLNLAITKSIKALKKLDTQVVALLYQHKQDAQGLCSIILINGCFEKFPLMDYYNKLGQIIKGFDDLEKILNSVLTHNDQLSKPKRFQIEQCLGQIAKEKLLCKQIFAGLKQQPAFGQELQREQEYRVLQAKLKREQAQRKAAQAEADRANAQATAAYEEERKNRAQRLAANQQYWAECARQEKERAQRKAAEEQAKTERANRYR